MKNLNVGDWVVTKDSIVKITHDDMPNLKYEDIERMAIKEDFIDEGMPVPTEFLEKRMYFLVPYNINKIQQGIQAGHAALEYARKYSNTHDFIDFVDNHKTWIILNGGTTNEKRELGSGKSIGTLNQILDLIAEREDINYAFFREPDLNDALTAICLIVDERVFNIKYYPDFNEWVKDKSQLNFFERIDLQEMHNKYIDEVGEDIFFLKEILNTKKLA